jgi:hypothetical protein
VAFRFDDSYKKASFLAAAMGGYRAQSAGGLHAYAGLGVGYVSTSYYKGPLVMPALEFGYRRFAIQGSYLPKVPDADSVAALQLKFTLVEW